MNRCKHCTRVMPDERTQKYCEICCAKGTKRSMKSYHLRREAGLCRRCGNQLEPERAGRSVCRECNTENTAYERTRRAIRVDQRRKRRRIKRAKEALMRMRGVK